jgi:hypothetical protein
MKGDKKIIKDPFVGEIELTEVGETSRHSVGEHIVDIIYEDSGGNYWIDTFATTGSEPQPMMFLRKTLIDEIAKLRNQKYYDELQPSKDILCLQESLNKQNNG